MDSTQAGSHHSLIPHKSSSRIDPTLSSLSLPPLSLSSPPLSPSTPGPSNLLRNFVKSNLRNFPLLARITRSTDGANNNNNSSRSSDNNNDNDFVDEDIYYNTLLHHRIQRGSLLVFHAPTRQVKILARSVSTGRCYSIPSTYQGLFHVLRKAFNSLEELLAWKDVNNSDIYKEFMTPKMEEVTIISPEPEYGHLLEAGDIIRVKPVPPNQPTAHSQRDDEEHDDVTANGNQNPRNNCSTFSQFYRSQGNVQLEIFDPISRKSRDIEVPFELQATMEEALEIDRLEWTVGKLTPLAQRQRIWVKLIQGGTDHPTEEEDLPLEEPLELVQVIAEPSAWVSDQNADAPLFHLPLRMDVYLKIVKQLQREKSPLLSENKILVSLLDRCVEHLPLEVFHDVLRQRYLVDEPLKLKPVASDNTESKGASVKASFPHQENYRQFRPPQLVYKQVSVNHRPRLHTVPEMSRSSTNVKMTPKPLPVRSQSIFARLLTSSSKTEPPLMEFPQVSKYRVVKRTSSVPRRPEPIRLVSAGKRHTKITHPAVTLTPAIRKVKETEYNFWREYETASGVFVEDEQSRNCVASAIVGRPDDAEVIDPYTRLNHSGRVTFRTPCSTGSDEVFQGYSTAAVHNEAEIPSVKNGSNQAILYRNAFDLYRKPIKSYGGNGVSDYEMAVPKKVPLVHHSRGELRSRPMDGSRKTGNNRQSVGVGAHYYGGYQTGSLMEMPTSGSDVDLINKPRVRKGKTPTNLGIPTAVARPKGSSSTGGQAQQSPGLSSSVQVLHQTWASGINTGSYQNINGWKHGKPRKNTVRHITVIDTSSADNDDDGHNPDHEIVRSKAFSERSLSENPNSKSNQRDADVFLDNNVKPRNVEEVSTETTDDKDEQTDLPYELKEEKNLPRDGNLYTLSTLSSPNYTRTFGL